MPLFWRLFLANAFALGIFISVLLWSPYNISDPPTVDQIAVTALAFIALLIVNAATLSQGLTPLADLRDAIDTTDVGSDQRIPERGAAEVSEVAAAYNDLLDRLEQERVASARAALRATEDERGRVARELHDVVGQTLTFLLLRVKAAIAQAPQDSRADLEAVADAARVALDEVRGLSRQLRPSALSDLGLGPALQALVEEARTAASTAISVKVNGSLGRDEERDLVAFRIVQEALTNVLKHAQATTAGVTAERVGQVLRLTVSDDGTGAVGVDGVGSYSMRERARLIGGRVTRESTPGRGTVVIAELPAALGPESESTVPPLDNPTRPIPIGKVLPDEHPGVRRLADGSTGTFALPPRPGDTNT